MPYADGAQKQAANAALNSSRKAKRIAAVLEAGPQPCAWCSRLIPVEVLLKRKVRYCQRFCISAAAKDALRQREAVATADEDERFERRWRQMRQEGRVL